MTRKWTQNHFINHLPTKLPVNDCILIFDKILQKEYSPWIGKFPKRISVSSGEKLKDVKEFPHWIEKIVNLSAGVPRSQLTIVVFGGGSVGDFGGFVASVLKRGVHLIQIPSTWLAAMDSAHGGKTALNVGQIKNQIGTFYLAEETYLVKDVLLNVPKPQIKECLGEFYKMALISGGKLWNQAKKEVAPQPSFLWKNLPALIQAKLKIVKKDPFEQNGLRHILNLGHTVGHVLESELGLAHGEAIHFGLLFSLNWGSQIGFYPAAEATHLFPSQALLKEKLKSIRNPSNKLLQDKKLVKAQELQFVFIQKPGNILIKKVKIDELLKEWRRQCQG